MLKKALLFLAVLIPCAGSTAVQAEPLAITDYSFVWHAAKVQDVSMDIEKSPEGLFVAISSPGGPLATVYATPNQAIAIAEVLKKTEDYYSKQMRDMDFNAEDVVPVQNLFKVYFSSSRGQNFMVRLRGINAFSAAVNMTRQEALGIIEHLLKAKEMAALVNERIRP
jgi:hypothetical protein